MEIFHNLIFGFSVAFSLQNLFYCFLGCLLGTLIGVLPGIGPLATIAMLMPITFQRFADRGVDHVGGHLLWRAVWRIDHRHFGEPPGETSAVVTCIDGYQMARQGRAGAALAIAALGSFFADRVHAFNRALRSADRCHCAQVRSSGVFLVDDDGAGHGGGPRPRRHGQVARDGGDGSAARLRGGVMSIPVSALYLQHHRADGRLHGFVVVAVGMFALGEIVANLGDPEDRTVFTSKVTKLLPTKDDLEAVHWSDYQRNGAWGIPSAFSPDRSGDRLVLVLYDRKKELPRTRLVSATARSRGWRDLNPQ